MTGNNSGGGAGSANHSAGTLVLIGTARNEFVIKALSALRLREGAVHLLVEKSRAETFSAGGTALSAFSGHISWRNLSLLRALRKIRPARIAIVIGDQFYHFNVVDALDKWIRAGLLPRAETFISFSIDPGGLRPWRFPSTALKDPWAILAHDEGLGWINRPTSVKRHIFREGGAVDGLFQMTIDIAGRRVTAPGGETGGNRPVMAIFGGTGVFAPNLSDEKTFPWRLQELLPGYRVINCSAPGYGVEQSLGMMKRVSGESQVAEAVLCVNGNVTDKAVSEAVKICEIAKSRFTSLDNFSPDSEESAGRAAHAVAQIFQPRGDRL
ncbi:MAG: hypothetical protein HY751_02410 [Nitrospinae bacterium]|nr:hypothetical protein [Nitrospinota bacterium]